MNNLVHGPYTLHTAATATADGNLVPCTGVGAVGVQIVDSLDGTWEIIFEGTIDGTNWVTLYPAGYMWMFMDPEISTEGLYVLRTGGYAQVRARITDATDCSLTCTAFLYEGEASDEGFLEFWTYLIAMSVSGFTCDTDDVTVSNLGTLETSAANAVTSLQTIDNFISGSRGLVTEDNSADIKTAVQTIDNFISGSRGLVTEDNSAAILGELQAVNSLVPDSYDYISLSYTGSNLTGVVFKSGGAGGDTISTLALAYDGSDNLTSVTKT